jgi:hypothetical protein
VKFNEIASRKAVFTGALLALLVVLAIASRMAQTVSPWFPPNFQAVAGTTLFAGFVFRSRALALVVPVAAMSISDQLLGGYDWMVMIAVYGSLAAPVLFGDLLQRRLSAARVVGAAAFSSVLFFLVTNLAVWCVWYPHTAEGFTRCFLRAIPFFAYTLAGDLVFAGGLFALYHFATAAARQSVVQQRTAALVPVGYAPLPVRS